MEDPQRFDVPVDGGAIVGMTIGSGPPVVLLHGGPGLSDYLGSLDDEVGSGYRMHRYQQRGLAPSTLSGPFTVEKHVEDAVTVLDAVAPEGAYVIGHSWGGHLSMYLAAWHPERVRGLVVVDPLGAVGDGGESEMGRLMQERIPPETLARANELDERAMKGEGSAGDAIEGLALVWPGYFAVPEAAPPMPPMAISLECYSSTWESIRGHFEKDTLAGLLPGLTMPTVFVLGAGSPIPPEHGLATAALVPGAKTEVHDGCGHFPWIERPGVVRSALDEVRRG